MQNSLSCLLTPSPIARILWELSRLQVRLSKLRNKSSDGPHGLFGFFVAPESLTDTNYILESVCYSDTIPGRQGVAGMNEGKGARPDDEVTTRDIERIARPRRTGWRVLRVGCLAVLLFTCAAVSSLVFALQGGPVDLRLPSSSTLKIGSDDFVLSNFSFKDGTTYYIDLDAGTSRDILQLQYLESTRSLQLVLHRATKGDREEDHLLTVPLP